MSQQADQLRCSLFHASLGRAMLYRKSTLGVLLGLIFFSFFGTLTASAWMFPRNYDWRYRVISNLLSPRDNPNHYWLAASGVALTGLLMLPFAGLLWRHLEVIAPRSAKLSAATFTAGIIALICACLVVPQHTHDVLGVRRLHELLGRSAAGFLAMGMLCSCWCAWKGRRRNPFAAQLFWIWSLVTLLPLVGIFFSESLLLFTRLEPSSATPIRSALRHSVFWHLGFWEWTGAVAVFLFLCTAAFLTPRRANLSHIQVTQSFGRSFLRARADFTNTSLCHETVMNLRFAVEMTPPARHSKGMVQPETHIRGNKNKKKIKQADFPAKAPEGSSDKCETGNAERSMHDLSCESPKECFPESYDRAKNDGSTNQAEKRSAHGVFQA